MNTKCPCSEGCVGCEKERRLQIALIELLKTNGCRSILASLIHILKKHRVDDIDAKLIESLDKAGEVYAGQMGLQWYEPFDFLGGIQ